MECNNRKIGVDYVLDLLLWICMLFEISTGSDPHHSSCKLSSICSCTQDEEDASSISASCFSPTFYRFPDFAEENISHLEIYGTKITTIEADSLAGCHAQELSLSNNKLQHVMDRALSSMKDTLISLDMGYNMLDTIPFGAFKELRNLLWLNLHRNQINSILGDWSHLRNTLVNLFIGENDITELSPETEDRLLKEFKGLHQFKSLVWLNLDGNKLFKIHKHSLPASLQTLSVSYNLIENFPLDSILTLPRLQWLYLRGNHIESLPDHKFESKLRLEKIDLSENDLKSLPRLLFNSSLYVRDLNLAFNDINVLVRETFIGLLCKRVILSYNNLEHVDINAFSGIEESLEYLDLDHNKLSEVPSSINYLVGLKYLYLSSNSLVEIPEDAFASGCLSLKAISFSGNRLSQIPTSALQNCTKISHFNFAYNELYEVDQSDFVGWGVNLETLVLSNNHITNLKSETFSVLNELRELSLSFNPLMYIDGRAFTGLSNLLNLEISFSLNREELLDEILKPLTNLQFLSADNNKFASIDGERSFNYLTSLKFINLEFNEIEFLPKNVFKPYFHTNLVDIRLNNNKLVEVNSKAFSNLTNLEVILLSGNQLATIEKDTFSHLPSLEHLILSDNLITRIHEHAFSNLPSLSKLSLQNNHLVEFDFKYFVNVSNLVLVNVSYNEIVQCDTDRHTLNVEVFDFSYNRLQQIPKCVENVGRLKTLFLNTNSISTIESKAFMHLVNLELLHLQENNLASLHRHAFFGLQNLQMLDLSNNFISLIHNYQFSTLIKLRVLNLSQNKLKYLPKDSLSNTQLEMLDLSNNVFSVVPSLGLAEVGNTLRHLYMSMNNIEHVDSTTFPDIPYLQRLELNTNRLTILPDNVFTSLGLLQKLDISNNPLRANFKELFHYAQNLKELSLASTGITTVPHLPLPNLISLNISHNNIEHIDKNSLQSLKRLRNLYLNHNELPIIPSHLWIHLSQLKVLDISYNPIKEIGAECFHGLESLQELNLNGLKLMKKFDNKSVRRMKLLTSLSMQTWPNIPDFIAQLCALLANMKQLRIFKLFIQENALEEQLMCMSNPKIRHLEISGRNLKYVQHRAFSKLYRNPDLTIKITDTDIEELPNGLFSNFYRTAHLSIELANNKLSHLSPEVLYVNYSSWKRVGATSIKGGLIISENNFLCGCHLAWLGHWLRRWARETLQSHTAPIDAAIGMNDLLKQTTCVDATSNVRKPIVQLPPEDMNCQASALSNAQSLNKVSVIFNLIFSVPFKLNQNNGSSVKPSKVSQNTTFGKEKSTLFEQEDAVPQTSIQHTHPDKINETTSKTNDVQISQLAVNLNIVCNKS